MKDTLITTCSVIAVIVLSVGIGEIALIGHQPGHVGVVDVAEVGK